MSIWIIPLSIFLLEGFRKAGSSSNKMAVVSLVAILLIILLAVVGPMISGHTYASMDTNHTNLPPRIPGLEKLGIFDGTENGRYVYQEKGLDDVYYWFGTDTLGRDLWTRTWAGTRVSLIIAFFAALGDLVIGVTYGMISGYLGGRTDMVMQRIIEIVNGIPSLVIMTLMVMIMSPGLVTIIVALLMTGWIGMSRMVRGEALKLKNEEYILASKTLGASTGRIITKNILPNVFGPDYCNGNVFHSGCYFRRIFPRLCRTGTSPAKAVPGYSNQ